MAFNHRKTVTHRLSQAARATRLYAGGHLAHVGLHPGQEGVLKALAEHDGQSMGDLATMLSVKAPTVTKMVSRLATQGYVERRASKGDAREAHVFLTERGREAVAAVDRIWKRVEKRALAGIEDKKRRELRRLLRHVEKNLGVATAGLDEAEISEIAVP
jgi:DNA-binding MarR family transcriptional regulator